SPWCNASARACASASFAVPINTKICRIRSGCCARAASGQAAAAPPSSVMNSRRFTQSPRRRGRGRNLNAKRAGGGQIDDQLKLARLHYRQVGRLSTLEDFAGVDADLTVRFRLARSVAHEAASFRILAYIIDGWNRMSCRQCSKLETPAGKERIRPYHE